ncbi:MAG: L-threonylcarbamoyladenylate synthase [Actinomycetota bacterium]
MSAQMRAAGDPGVAEAAARVLDSGGVVVLPTDTVYGIAARLDRPEGVEKIFKIKSRPATKPLPVLVGSFVQASAIGQFSDEAARAGVEHWPGPMTIVVPSLSDLSVLGSDGKTVGLRVPAHELVLEILSLSGPLAATSANVSGSPTCESIEGIRDQLGGEVGLYIGLYIDGGVLDSPPSEVVSFAGGRTKLR